MHLFKDYVGLSIRISLQKKIGSLTFIYIRAIRFLSSLASRFLVAFCSTRIAAGLGSFSGYTPYFGGGFFAGSRCL
jgi:hypothetical protein